MSLDILPDESILQICQDMDLQSVEKFTRTSSRNYSICHEVLVDRIVESLHGSKMDKYDIDVFLANLSGDDDFFDDSDVDKYLPVLLQDPRTDIDASLFAQAFKSNLYNSVKTMLELGKIDPNDPEIFENIKDYEDEYFPGHKLVELIVSDPRTTPESRRLYEQKFLASHSVERGHEFPKKQFVQFYLYKFKFNSDDIRKVSEDLTLGSSIGEKLQEYTHFWVSTYLKNIDDPTVDDFLFFTSMIPKVEEVQEFLDRMGQLSDENKVRIASEIHENYRQISYDPESNTVGYLD